MRFYARSRFSAATMRRYYTVARIYLFVAAGVLCWLYSFDVEAGNRVALVIENSDYRVAPLSNPGNDARDMAAKLTALGFDVTLKLNAERQEMSQAGREFGKRLQRDDVGLFYYAGHAIQVAGANYLIPVNANIELEDEVRFEAIDASSILAKMDSAGNRINFVILDACRNNPFARSFRSTQRGLRAYDDAPVGSLIAFSTGPNRVANDGEGRNSPYTKHLLKALDEPGLTAEQVFKRVRNLVIDETGGTQVPWESTSLRGDFYFRSPREPRIDYFTVSDTDILQGQSVEFNWKTLDATEINISNHGPVKGEGSIVITPANTTTYEITASNKAGGIANKRVTVKVSSEPPPKIRSFVVSPATITDGDSTTLSWEVADAITAEISTLGQVPLSGSRKITPTQSRMYVLSAINKVGQKMQVTRTVNVAAEPKPDILSFAASLSSIKRGSSTTLSWQVHNAREVTLLPLGPVASRGSRSVDPSQTTIYRLVAKNSKGESTESVIAVEVAGEPPPRIVIVELSPWEINKGESSLLSWEVQNSANVNISSIGKVPPAGSHEVSPKETTNYLLVAKNTQGDEAARSINLVVKGSMDRFKEDLYKTKKVLKAKRQGLIKSHFVLPGDGETNTTGCKGPFCDTGEIITIQPIVGAPIGYGFYRTEGEKVLSDGRHYAKAISVGLSARTDIRDKKAAQEKLFITFQENELSPGTVRLGKVGSLKYEVKIKNITTRTEDSGEYFRLDSVILEVSVEKTDANEQETEITDQQANIEQNDNK